MSSPVVPATLSVHYPLYQDREELKSHGHEFSTGEELVPGTEFSNLVHCMRENILYGFTSLDMGVALMNMKNVLFIHYKKTNPDLIQNPDLAQVPIQINLLNHPVIELNCPCDIELLKEPTTPEKVEKLYAQTIDKLVQHGKVSTFSNGNETLIFKSKNLVSISTRR